jgi:hypothetical protein
MPVAGVRCGEHHVLAGGRGQAKLTVGVLAELPLLQVATRAKLKKQLSEPTQ